MNETAGESRPFGKDAQIEYACMPNSGPNDETLRSMAG
jgi:hypothetical protein